MPGLVSRASPSPREGRVWSTSHHGFVSVCHDFLGVLTTNDAHRRVVARAVHAVLTVHMHTVFPRVEAAATINLTCLSTAATIRGRLLYTMRVVRARTLNKLLHYHTRTPRGWGGLG